MAARTFSLTLTDSPTALQRVVTVIARRCCTVTALHFDDGIAEIEIAGTPRQLRQLGAWLESLVDVTAVTEAPAVLAVPR